MADKQIVAYLVRHGATVLNDQQRYRGQKDVPLDEQGKKEAEEAANFLKDKPIGRAWTSDLSRADDTGKAILKGRKIKQIKDKNLRPLDSGEFAGEKKDENKEKMDYYLKHTDKKIPGGESIDQLNERTRHSLFRAFRAGLRTGKPSLVSTHSSVIHSTGELLHNNHKVALVKPGGIVEVVWDGKKFRARPAFKAKMEPEAHYAS